MQYCVSLKTVVQPKTSGHMPCHGEFSNQQIPTFLVKILDTSGLMEHTHGIKKYHHNQGKQLASLWFCCTLYILFRLKKEEKCCLVSWSQQ